MFKTGLYCLGLVGLSAPYFAMAQTEEKTPPSPIKYTVEFGYRSHSGNTNSEAMNGRLRTDYTSGSKRTTAEWKYYRSFKDDVEDKRTSSYSLQSDYKLGPKRYLYCGFKGIDSRYSAYYRDHTLSSGLGYQYINTDDVVVEVELGPGYRYQKPNIDKIGSTDIIFPKKVEEAIFRGHMKSSWKVFENLSLSADITTVSGNSNTRIDSDISATNDITEGVALKISHSTQYHNKVPTGLSKRDSSVSIKLRFSF